MVRNNYLTEARLLRKEKGLSKAESADEICKKAKEDLDER